MIKVEPCKGCGGVLLVDDFMGVRLRCEVTPLDAQTAGAALLAEQGLHRVTYLGGRPSSFGAATPAVLGALRLDPGERPVVVVTHRCATEAVQAHQRASRSRGEGRTPKAPLRPSGTPSVAVVTPSSVPSTTPSGARTAENRPSEPRCSGCGEPCKDGTYAAIELGDILVWAAHVDSCGA